MQDRAWPSEEEKLLPLRESFALENLHKPLEIGNESFFMFLVQIAIFGYDRYSGLTPPRMTYQSNSRLMSGRKKPRSETNDCRRRAGHPLVYDICFDFPPCGLASRKRL